MKNIALTIDFEDFRADLKRYLNLSDIYKVNEDALSYSYDLISKFCINKLNNKKLTFFCTGIIAEKFPNIIKSISNDGHEIACHSFYHDRVNKMPIREFDYYSQKAKNILQDVSNQSVQGFRAPFFSITKNDKLHFKIIEKHFKYDSSLFINKDENVQDIKLEIGLEKLNLLPVSSKSFFNKRFNIKSGGTFFKVFPEFITKKIIYEFIESNKFPIIYLHPYEFIFNQEFRVRWSEMNKLNYKKRIYWNLKQYQWDTIGNSTTLNKLKSIFDSYSCSDTLAEIQNYYV